MEVTCFPKENGVQGSNHELHGPREINLHLPPSFR